MMRSKSRKPNWASANLDAESERAALFKQEEERAADRVKRAFKQLQEKGVVDRDGNLLAKLPAYTEADPECNVGG